MQREVINWEKIVVTHKTDKELPETNKEKTNQ